MLPRVEFSGLDCYLFRCWTTDLTQFFYEKKKILALPPGIALGHSAGVWMAPLAKPWVSFFILVEECQSYLQFG